MPDRDVQPEELREYEAKTSSGTPYTVQLTPTDAKRLGLDGGQPDAEAYAADADTTATPTVQPADEKARTSSNKARTTDTK